MIMISFNKPCNHQLSEFYQHREPIRRLFNDPPKLKEGKTSKVAGEKTGKIKLNQ